MGGVLLAVGCEDRVTAGDDGSSSGMPASSTGDDEDDDGASGPADASTSMDASSTTTPDESACDDADPDACPPGCTRAVAWRIEDDACTASENEVCVPAGADASTERSTFWSEGPDGLRFVETGGDCGIDLAPGEGWTECAGSVDEPAECACFCAQGSCPGDDEYELLESCGFDEPCEELQFDTFELDADDAVTTCWLEAWRDRVPGVYQFRSFGGFAGGVARFYLEGTRVHRLAGGSTDVIECPADGTWPSSDACELASTEYFDDCVGLVGTDDDCIAMFDAWATDCVPQDAACPE